MIRSWKGGTAKLISEGQTPRGMSPGLASAARRRLNQLARAKGVEDMREPLGNRLHRLTGDRAGQWSVSVNDQFRICFTWNEGGPDDVEFVDYH